MSTSPRATSLSGLAEPVSRLCACGCGSSVVGRADKRYASEACSKRARRATSTVTPFPSDPPSTAVADALGKELQALGVIDTYEASTALGLARQLDSGQLVGAGYVSLSKELDRRVDALRLRAERSDDPLRRIRDRLDERTARLHVVRDGAP